MKIKIENLGKIKKGKIETNKLLVLCGPNNYGKTYLAYTLYGIYKELKTVFYILEEFEKEELENNEELTISKDNFFEQIKEKSNLKINDFKRHIHSFFNTSESFFKNFKIEVEFNFNDLIRDIEDEFSKIIILEDDVIKIKSKKQLNKILEAILGMALLKNINNEDFIFPSTREGINLFYKELNINRNNFFLEASKNSANNLENLLSKKISRYSEPISDYINFINEMDVFTDSSSTDKKNDKSLVEALEDIVGGEYKIVNSAIYFTPKGSNMLIDLHMASSTVRTLAGLYIFIKNKNKNARIIIDEPELNLHPDNQRKMARLLVKMINSGIEVIITTHSSYIMQELNNLIVFNKEFENKENLKKKYRYTDDEFLDYRNINCYLVDNNTIEEMPKDDCGIELKTFNEVIDSLNELTSDLLFETECE